MAEQFDPRIKVGMKGFGQVNGYPPAEWMYDGKRNGSHTLVNVKPKSQSRAYPDQFVTLEDLQRILLSKED